MSLDATRADEQWAKAVALRRSGDAQGALFLFRSLAESGEDAALREVANIYLRGGRGVEKDPSRAEEWFRKSAASGDAWGYYGLAMMSYYGFAGARDYQTALENLRGIDDGKRPLVSLMLGRIYMRGHGIERDLRTAADHLQKAVAHGNLIALKELAVLNFRQGNYVRAAGLGLSAFARIFKELSRDARSPALRSY